MATKAEKKQELEKKKFENIFTVLQTKEDLYKWAKTYLKLRLTYDTVDPDSNSNPVEAAWEIYTAVRDNTGDVIPGYILLSSRDSYKCQEKGTLIRTTKCVKPIEDVCVGDVVWTGWNWKKVSAHIDDGFKDGLCLTLENGLRVTGTPVHKYWVLRSGTERWVESRNLKSTDLICMSTDVPNDFDIQQDEFDIGYFLGLLTGDGGLSMIDKHKRVGFTSNDEAVRNWFFDFIQKNWGVKPYVANKIDIIISNRPILAFIKEMGMKTGYSFEKDIPSYCYTSHSAMVGFISGVFDTDGTFTKKKTLDFPMTAQKLLVNMQKVFASYGIQSRLKPVPMYEQNKHQVFKLTVNCNEIQRLYDVGCRFIAKKAQKYEAPILQNTHSFLPKEHCLDLIEFSKTTKRRRGHKFEKPKICFKRNLSDTHEYKGITYDKVEELLNWTEEAMSFGQLPKNHELVSRYRRILEKRWFSFSVEKQDSVHFYDMEVEDDHSYCGNGIISHNTIIASVLEVLLLVHFQVTLSHMAAIKSQSQKAISYINSFFMKIDKYLEQHSWKKISESKSRIEYITPQGNQPYITVIIASLTGANSEHTNILCVDGKTKILVKNPRETNRKRIVNTARGIHYAINRGETVEALSFNHSNGEIEFRRITNSYLSQKNVYEVRFQKNRCPLLASGDHQVFVLGRGYTSIRDVAFGDGVVRIGKAKTLTADKNITKIDFPVGTEYRDSNPDHYVQVMLGSLLGDGGVYKKTTNNPYYQEIHGIKQKNYLVWKKEILATHLRMREYLVKKNGYSQKPAFRINSGNTKDLLPWVDFKKTFDGVENLGALGLAVWFMDDGSGAASNSSFRFHTEGFSLEQNQRLKGVLEKNFDISVDVATETKKDGRSYLFLSGGAEAFWRLYDICRQHIHPSMMYKFDGLLKKGQFTCKYCGKVTRRHLLGNTTAVDCYSPECRAIQKKNMKIDRVVSITQTESVVDMFDFVVEDNHNFFANGVLVHNCIDEIDVIANPQAFKEAKFIPGVMNGRYPLTIKLSTRKFAFGLMNQEIDNISKTGEKLLRWNILDTCECCPASRHLPEKEKIIRMVAKALPLVSLTEEQFKDVPETKHSDYDKIEAHAGCADCILLPVCRTRLATKPVQCTGGFYKPIPAVINLFRTNTPDMAEAQLLCWKPSSKGLVYPRFSEGNLLTIDQAYFHITGRNLKNVSLDLVRRHIIEMQIPVVCGVDWGYTHMSAFVVVARLPNGDFWVVDTVAMAELELDDLVKIGLELKEKWNIARFYVDQAYPAYIKTFRRHGLSCPKFTKDVPGGIEAIRGQIVNAEGRRHLKVLATDNNQQIVLAVKTHHFKLDAAGNPTKDPDDDEGIADIADALRYVGQNVCLKNNKIVVDHANTVPQKQQIDLTKPVDDINVEIMKNRIAELTENPTNSADSQDKSRKGLMWSF